MNFDENEKFIYHSIQKRYGIIGSTKPIQEALELLIQAAPTDLTVLITGETGTGKEVFANALHGLSNRNNKPFVSVNCGAIPENLLESELFGHEKGAFTSADDQRIGFFESANNGTIFLDEIGELPLGTQVKLLRVLESGEFTRLGSSVTKKVNVRILAATNRELEKEVKQGNFRQDLFYRLNSVRINLPPLRKHIEDIIELVDYIAYNKAKKIGIDYLGLDNEAVDILKSLPWPGNIRELKNLIETLITLEKAEFITSELVKKYIPRALPAHKFLEPNEKTSLISLKKEDDFDGKELGLIFRSLLEIKNEISDLKYDMQNLSNEIKSINKSKFESEGNHFSPINSENQAFEYLNDKTLEEIEKQMILRNLERFNGNRRIVAEKLGISERTLYRKIRDYELK